MLVSESEAADSPKPVKKAPVVRCSSLTFLADVSRQKRAAPKKKVASEDDDDEIIAAAASAPASRGSRTARTAKPAYVMELDSDEEMPEEDDAGSGFEEDSDED